MIEFGKTLREAREAKGYSVSQLAEITHILPQIIENLEKEDFTRIVAPIYGRGFVKLYCETVGLDAQPLVAEFMEIYNGNRQPSIRIRSVEVEPEAPAAEPSPDRDPISEEPPAKQDIPVPEPPSFDFSDQQKRENLFDAPPKPEPPPEPVAPVTDDLDLPFRAEPNREEKRDYRLPGYSMPEVPRGFWRFGILIVATVAVIALLLVGTRALYRVTMQVPEEEVQSTECQVPSAGKDVAAPKHQAPSTKHQEPSTRQPRKGVPVPPLYID